MKGPIEVEASRDSTVARISIPLAGNGTDDESNAALATLREESSPPRSARLPAPSTRSAA